MLYDPKWEIEVKADPFSLESLIAWLEKQPADGAYDYRTSTNCMLCQYLAAMGYREVTLDRSGFDHAGDRRNTPYPKFLYEVAIGKDWSHGWTYGAALARAREALSH